MELRTNVRQTGEDLRAAGQDLSEAGGAAAALVRQAASEAPELVGEVLETARERASEAANAVSERASGAANVVAQVGQRAARSAGRTAVEITAQALSLPERVRESARRSLELVEEAGTQIVSSVLNVGSRALSKAVDYVNEIVPRRRVRHQALEQLVLEQLAWVQCTTEALERSAGEIVDDQLRMQLVRSKLQAIRHIETLSQLLGAVGGRMRAPDEMPRVRPATVNGAGHPGNGRVCHDLASAFSAAVQGAEGWRALAQISALAEPERISEALGRACEVVGREPDEQVDLLREALTNRTVESVLI